MGPPKAKKPKADVAKGKAKGDAVNGKVRAAVSASARSHASCIVFTACEFSGNRDPLVACQALTLALAIWDTSVLIVGVTRQCKCLLPGPV
jgi:hypothetical protein